ncbi:MAG: hypothetical protein L6R37_008444, partial [Teloschistes peruensis]
SSTDKGSPSSSFEIELKPETAVEAAVEAKAKAKANTNATAISTGVRKERIEKRTVKIASMRKWLEPKEQLETWKQQYIRSLSAAFPSGEYENWASCQALFPHAKSAIAQRPKAEGPLSEWASLMYNAAWYAWRKGDAVEAVQLSRRALDVRKKILGPEHKGTLTSMGLVGLAYSLGGRWKEAEELQVQVMETTKRVLGEEHPFTLSSMNNLAFTLKSQSRNDEAISRMNRYLKLRKNSLAQSIQTETSLEALNRWEHGEDEP